MENKGYVIAIVILVLIIIGLGGFIYYDKFYKTEEEKATITTINDVSIDLNVLYQVEDTLNKFDTAFGNSNSRYLGYIYKDRLYAKDFDKSAALYASIYNDLENTTVKKNLIGGNVKRSFEGIFGDYLRYEARDIADGVGLDVSYDASSDRYTYTSDKNSDIYSPQYIIKNISTSLTKDSIIVRRKIFYVEYNGDGNNFTSATIYTSNDKTQMIGTINLKNGTLSVDEVLAKYSSKLKTYKYTFKEHDQSNYNFYLIERDR